MILELDESDGTIDFHSPYLTTLLNCDWDHVDRYKSPEELSQVFLELLKEQSHVCLFPRESLAETAQKEFADKTQSFDSALDSIDFMKSNEAAVVATAHAMGVDVSSIDFSRFPGMGGVNPSFLKSRN